MGRDLSEQSASRTAAMAERRYAQERQWHGASDTPQIARIARNSHPLPFVQNRQFSKVLDETYGCEGIHYQVDDMWRLEHARICLSTRKPVNKNLIGKDADTAKITYLDTCKIGAVGSLFRAQLVAFVFESLVRPGFVPDVLHAGSGLQ